MLADFNFYKNTYKGIAFADETSYEYYGERASDKLALYSSRFTDGEALTRLQKCACKIAEILLSAKGDKTGKKIASESIGGYYSVSYTNKTESEVNAEINSAIREYIGSYILGARKVMW